MSYSEELEKINALKQEIDLLLPLDDEAEEKLWKKLRLEWNFNSNHIEGNTLTYFETRLFLLLGNTSGDHKAREYEEMKAHDVAVETVKKWANDKERKITEKEIRELNQIILVSPFWKDAQTPDGSFTKREIVPGEYKKYPNHVRLENGEIFHYAEPNEVGSEMQELLNWYHNQNELHPVVKAGLLHYKFVRIHPFDDGNGRVARLLMNYHLIRNGYSPVIIKSSDKRNYIFALNKADAGDLDAFVEYISLHAIWSMNIYLLAAKNENIEENEDWKKELKLIKENVNSEPLKRDEQVLKLRFEDSIFPAIKLILSELEKQFDGLFETNRFNITLQNNVITPSIKNHNIDRILMDFKSFNNLTVIEIKFDLKWKNYKKNGINVFDIEINYAFSFDQFSYAFTVENSLDFRVRKRYDQILSEVEVENIINQLGSYLVYQIQTKTAK